MLNDILTAAKAPATAVDVTLVALLTDWEFDVATDVTMPAC